MCVWGGGQGCGQGCVGREVGQQWRWIAVASDGALVGQCCWVQWQGASKAILLMLGPRGGHAAPLASCTQLHIGCGRHFTWKGRRPKVKQ